MAPFHLVYTDSKTWRLQVESQVNNSRLNCDKPSLVLGSQGIRLISSRQPYLTMASYSGGKFKQDMPPPGGYADIEYKRIPAQRIIGYKSAFIASSILTVYGYYYYSKRRVYLNRLKTDFRDHMIALEPLALAEQDRSFLRQLRHNRNVERDLMKNVPDWKVGTLWGKSVYENQPFNTIPNVSLAEYYGHRDTWNTRHVSRPNWDVGLEDNDD